MTAGDILLLMTMLIVGWVVAARQRNGFFFLLLFSFLRIRVGVTHKCPNAVKNCMEAGQKVLENSEGTVFYFLKFFEPGGFSKSRSHRSQRL